LSKSGLKSAAKDLDKELVVVYGTVDDASGPEPPKNVKEKRHACAQDRGILQNRDLE
jgi:hypothetical protein